MLPQYKDLLSRYVREGLPNQDELCDLFQYLLDTDLIDQMSPRMQQYAEYLIMEGFLYDIPSAEE